MVLGNRLRWVFAAGVLAIAAGAEAQSRAVPPAGGPADAQIGFKKATQLTPRQELAEAEKMIGVMEAGAADVRGMLEKARQKRDVVKSLGLNDKLSRLDTIIRAARARKAALQSAVEALHGRGETGGGHTLNGGQGWQKDDDRRLQDATPSSANAKVPGLDDPPGGGSGGGANGAGSAGNGITGAGMPTSTEALVELANHEYMILLVLYAQAQGVISEANQVIGEEAAYFGSTVVELSVDPTLGPGDEATFPNTDVTIVVAPPISASPSK